MRNQMSPNSSSLHPTQHFFLGITLNGFHEIHYVEWGDPTSSKVALCVHGMSRNARDFDYLAKKLVEQGYRVVCPDLPGRGKSHWHTNPQHYNTPQHIQEMMSLLARVNVESVDWIGTSMGGIIGLVLASYPKSPIRKLILNDIGPYIPAAPLNRIVQYLNLAPTFKNKTSARKYLRQLLSTFGSLKDEHMDHLMEHSYFTSHDGKIQLAYDPQILTNITSDDVDLWHMWESIDCPVLILRGEQSEILSPEIAQRMLLKENVHMVEFPDVAHAPSLMDDEQLRLIGEWLEE